MSSAIEQASTQADAARLYLIKWDETEREVAEVSSSQTGVVHRFTRFPGLVCASLTPEQAEQWRQIANVRYVEPDFDVSIRWGDEQAVPMDAYGMMRPLQQVRAAQMQEKGICGKGVRVALLDTGLNTESKRLRVAGGVSFVADEPEFGDQQGHGTAMAGLIGLQPSDAGKDTSRGIAPDASLYAVKVLNRMGRGKISAVLLALEWAIEQQMDIVTMCFGTPTYSAALEEALEIAYAHGLLLVAPTGNIGAADGVDFPARYHSVIAVGAVDERNRLAPFSNQGPEVELVAPGVSIPALYLQDLPLMQSGTSLSAACVAGVAALLKSAEPTRSNHQLREWLKENATELGDREQYGFGLVNADGGLEFGMEAETEAEKDTGLATGLTETKDTQEAPQEALLAKAPNIAPQQLPNAEAPNSTPQQALPLETGRKIRAVLPSAEAVHWYRVELQADDAIEVELSDIPRGCAYEIEIYDATQTRVAQAISLSNTLKIATLEAAETGSHFIKIFTTDSFDAQHPYALHVDRYASLSGLIADHRTLSAEAGPYKLGQGGLTLASGAVLDVEPGTILNVRSEAPIRLQAGATLNLLGELEQQIVILGARGEQGNELWTGLQFDAETAQVHFQHLTIQYDAWTSTPPLADFQLPVEHPTAPLLPNEATTQVTPIPPSQRPAATQAWYVQASPYHFSIWDPFTLKMQSLYFGIDVEIFTQWECESTRLSDERYARGDVNYWEFVNARFLRDTAEAQRLVEAGETAAHYRVQRLVDYLKAGQAWTARHGLLKLGNLLQLLRGDNAEAFYHHFQAMAVSFWLSHNTAIVYWDKQARERGLWQAEDLYEAHFINGVIIRLDFSSDMPFAVPLFGHNTPPIGLIGFLLHHGPFHYPKEYPAPEPPPAPEGTLDYESETTLELVKTYLQYLLRSGTSSVFTWWLPTPSDREISRLKQQPGLLLLSSPEDWKREILEPAWKSVEVLEAKYLQDDPTDLQTVKRDYVSTLQQAEFQNRQ